MATETCLPIELEFVFAAALPDETLPAGVSQPVRPEPEPELSVYRKYTIALLRRYMQLSIEIGRVLKSGYEEGYFTRRGDSQLLN